jgi:hypothetical protein
MRQFIEGIRGIIGRAFKCHTGPISVSMTALSFAAMAGKQPVKSGEVKRADN